MEKKSQKKTFSEEAALDKMEKKVDRSMEKLMNKWMFATILNHKIVKDILGSQIVNDANAKLQAYLKTIFIVVGRILLISWVVGLFSFLISLSGLGFMFSLWFGIGLRVLVYALLAIAFALVSLLTWLGLIRFKKRVISLAILWTIVSALSLVVTFVPVGFSSYTSYGTPSGSFLNLLLIYNML